METTAFGNTGLRVSRLGFGLAQISREETAPSVREAGRVLNTALDGGINLLDTAACYGATEELIGSTVAHRRDEYVLATKAGHVVGGSSGEPWTARTIGESIERSLERLRTDRVDLVQLHSPDLDVLERGEAIEALLSARDAGKTRFLGCSGDNEAARWAVESGVFDVLQTSFNLVDQRARNGLFELAEARGLGIIVKRPIANGAWGKSASPYSYADEYFRRAQAMAQAGPIPGAPQEPIHLAMGFVLGFPEVDTIIVGSHNPSHVQANIDMVEQGLSIPDEARAELKRRFDELGDQWLQLM